MRGEDPDEVSNRKMMDPLVWFQASASSFRASFDKIEQPNHGVIIKLRQGFRQVSFVPRISWRLADDSSGPDPDQQMVIGTLGEPQLTHPPTSAPERLPLKTPIKKPLRIIKTNQNEPKNNLQ